MKIGIIGAGNIGGSLGKVWSTKGHQIVFGVRDPNSDKTRKALAEIGANAQALSIAEASTFGEILVLAVPWTAVKETIASLGNVRDKIIIDATNRIAIQPGDGPTGAEDIAKWAVGAHVVKAFSTMGWEAIRDPIFSGIAVTAFICGDEAAAKETVMGLARETGLRAIDAGPLANVAALDSLAKLWIYMMRNGAGRDMAFTMIKR